MPGQPAGEMVLPDESQLPNAPKSPLDDEQDGGIDRSEESPLPDETQLPTSSKPTQVEPQREEPAVADDVSPLKLENSADQRPWLRLSLKGHVGPVRTITFSSDGSRLYAAGDDKHTIAWRVGEDGSWSYERTIRWQVQRGSRGRIYAVSAMPGLLALGGLAADGANGEILLLDAATGRLAAPLIDAQIGHVQRITGLACSHDREARALASIDLDGRLLHWRPDETGQWRAQLVQLEQSTAQELQFWRTLHPIAMQGAATIFAPDYAGANQNGEATWRIARWTEKDGRFSKQLIGGPTASHTRMVTAMATSTGNVRLASADEAGNLWVWWDLDASPSRIELKSPATMLSFSAEGGLLLAGTAGGEGTSAELMILDTSRPRIPRRVRTLAVSQRVLAGAVSPRGRFFAYSQGGDVIVRQLEQRGDQPTRLVSGVRPPRRVAFARKEPFYRVAISRGSGDNAPLDAVFDPSKPQLESAVINPAEWLTPRTSVSGWTVKQDGTQAWLQTRSQRAASIPLNVDQDGLPTASCWLTNQQGMPYAVAVATSASNNIFVFAPALNGEARLLRQYRGHWATVTSLAASADRRYLASASADGTVRFWMLEGLGLGAQVNRWGATFTTDEDGAVVDTIRDDGPLYFRGIRQGDRITRLRLPRFAADRSVEISEVVAPRAMVQALSVAAPAQMVAFDYRRAGVEAKAFQSYPAWQPTASLVISTNREWAFWTPSGFYDASFEGHQLFGWQVNRGPRRLPDYFLASQVRRFLERPDVMADLLEAGSAEAAFRSANRVAPANWSSVVRNQNLLRPDVSILEPPPNKIIATGTFRAAAKVVVDSAQQIIPPKLFVNGAIATQRRLVNEQVVAGRREFDYEWVVHPPGDKRLLIHVATATDEEVVGQDRVLVRNNRQPAAGPSQLFLIAAGVNDYPDAQIPNLDYAVDNALGFTRTLKEDASELYELSCVTLLNEHVTKSVWGLTMESFARRVAAQATPDDVLVIYLSGHGVRDDITDDYYFVASDVRYADVVAGRFADCLSISDLEVFAELPCRKLVVLDTCHSGAVQPTTQRELKAALRLLQEDFYFTLTASEGTQEAVEDRGKRLGRFTYHLLQSLDGRADRQGDSNGVVTLPEVVDYVKKAVAADSSRNRIQQHPTAGPADIIELTNMPVTAVSQ